VRLRDGNRHVVQRLPWTNRKLTTVRVGNGGPVWRARGVAWRCDRAAHGGGTQRESQSGGGRQSARTLMNEHSPKG
jgi:hypothetical protein